MFKDIKLGTKIASGFGVLIVIMCALGGAGVFKMKGVEDQSKILAEEYVPEMDMAVDLRAAVNRLMYEMRGYGFTEEKKYYDNAQKELQAIDKLLAAGHVLEKKSPHLKKLKGEIQGATRVIEKYKVLIQKTAQTNAKMKSHRKVLDESARKYMTNSNDFLTGQNKRFKIELDERQKKVALVSHLVALGSAARVLNFKALAFGEPGLMKKAISKMNDTNKEIAKLRKITRTKDNIWSIEDIEDAAKDYQSTMSNFLANSKKVSLEDSAILQKYRRGMDKYEEVYVKNCADLLEGQQKNLTRDMMERNTKITLINDIINLGNDSGVKAFKSQALRNPIFMEEAVSNFSKIDKKFEALLAITRLAEDINRIDEIKSGCNAYKNAMIGFLGNWKYLQDLGNKRGNAGREVISLCKTMADAGMTATEKIVSETVSSLSSASWIMIIGLLISLVVGVIVAVLITKSITGPLNRVIEGMNEGADQVASASGQVSSSSQSLAEGASQQAASIEETLSSLEEMSSMTKQNADNASQADSLMKEANQVVTSANKSMTELITSMQDISNASDETQKVVKTIDEIAFQTNLLALNAAVEAARAGEAGAGFAVVAEEVRNLALRSAEAAKNTAVLIEGTVKKVKDGSELVDKTNDEFAKVVGSTSKVGELVGEISAASNEQSQGIGQVNIAVTETDKVTQQNAANAEESASASEELNAQAQAMKSMVGELMAMVNGAGETYDRGKKPARYLAGESAVPVKKNKGMELTVNKAQEIIPMDDDFKDF